MDLYDVTTKVFEYSDCKNVVFSWFRTQGARTRPYRDLIEGFDMLDEELIAYAKGAVDELFTAIEANALKEYLDREHGDDGTTTIEKAKLPMQGNVMGLGAIPLGGGPGCYMLDEEANYSLPFKVRGYFDLRGCELVDGSDVYRHRLWLVAPDGTMRQQTNQEARLMETTGTLASVQ